MFLVRNDLRIISYHVIEACVGDAQHNPEIPMSSDMVQLPVDGSANPKVHSCLPFLVATAGKAACRGIDLQRLDLHFSLIHWVEAYVPPPFDIQ
jgi:hypothetical protein